MAHFVPRDCLIDTLSVSLYLGLEKIFPPLSRNNTATLRVAFMSVMVGHQILQLSKRRAFYCNGVLARTVVPSVETGTIQLL